MPIELIPCQFSNIIMLMFLKNDLGINAVVAIIYRQRNNIFCSIVKSSLLIFCSVIENSSTQTPPGCVDSDTNF